MVIEGERREKREREPTDPRREQFYAPCEGSHEVNQNTKFRPFGIACVFVWGLILSLKYSQSIGLVFFFVASKVRLNSSIVINSPFPWEFLLMLLL